MHIRKNIVNNHQNFNKCIDIISYIMLLLILCFFALIVYFRNDYKLAKIFLSLELLFVWLNNGINELKI